MLADILVLEFEYPYGRDLEIDLAFQGNLEVDIVILLEMQASKFLVEHKKSMQIGDSRAFRIDQDKRLSALKQARFELSELWLSVADIDEAINHVSGLVWKSPKALEQEFIEFVGAFCFADFEIDLTEIQLSKDFNNRLFNWVDLCTKDVFAEAGLPSVSPDKVFRIMQEARTRERNGKNV